MVVVAGCCWLLLVVVGCCWLLLVVVGCCWLLLVVDVVDVVDVAAQHNLKEGKEYVQPNPLKSCS